MSYPGRPIQYPNLSKSTSLRPEPLPNPSLRATVSTTSPNLSLDSPLDFRKVKITNPEMPLRTTLPNNPKFATLRKKLVCEPHHPIVYSETKIKTDRNIEFGSSKKI